MNVVALIPVRAIDVQRTGGMLRVGSRPLLSYSIDAAKQASTVNRVVVSTDSEDVRQLARELGAETPFLRPLELAASHVPLGAVLKHAVEWLDRDGYYADIVVLLEMTHPLRPVGLIDQLVNTLVQEKLDTVFAAFEERATFWEVNDYGELSRIGEEGETRSTKRSFYKELAGLGSAMRAGVARQGQQMGARVGLVPVRDLAALVDAQDEVGLALLRRLVDARE